MEPETPWPKEPNRIRFWDRTRFAKGDLFVKVKFILAAKSHLLKPLLCQQVTNLQILRHFMDVGKKMTGNY
jgi:hypothetical protein